jgi:hypothetical protein
MIIKKVGRPTLKGEPLTNAEKKQRYKEKTKCYAKAAESSGYKLYPVLISTKQLEALSRYYYLDSSQNREARGNGLKIDNERINDVIYHAFKMYLEALGSNLLERGFPIEVVDTCINPNDYPADYYNLSQVEVESARLFQEWEESQ